MSTDGLIGFASYALGDASPDGLLGRGVVLGGGEGVGPSAVGGGGRCGGGGLGGGERRPGLRYEGGNLVAPDVDAGLLMGGEMGADDWFVDLIHVDGVDAVSCGACG